MSTTKNQPTTTRTKTSAARRSATARRRRSSPPWVEGGIDYGPARVATRDLARWAFALAEASVGDCRESKRRVRRARQYVLDALRGKRVSFADHEADITFTTWLLLRIFDGDLQLGMGDVMATLRLMGLPTDDVPVAPPRPVRAPAQVVPLRNDAARAAVARAALCNFCGADLRFAA
jgi:hypothetical protein